MAEQKREDKWFALCGFEETYLQKFYTFFDIADKSEQALLMTMLCHARMNVTWEQLFVLQQLLSDDRPQCARTLRRKYTQLAVKVKAKVNPLLRFSDMRGGEEWADISFLCDGTHLVTKKKKKEVAEDGSWCQDKTWDDKHETHSWNLLVFTTLSGVPIHWSSPQFGSVHDATIYKQMLGSLPHHMHEMGLCDLGFVGQNHAITPVKSIERAFRDEPLSRHIIEKWIAKYRSRIERIFGNLCIFKMFYESTALDVDTLGALVDVALSCVHCWYLFRADPPYSDETKLRRTDMFTEMRQAACICEGQTWPRLVSMAKAARYAIADNAPLRIVGKPEGHASKRRRDEYNRLV